MLPKALKSCSKSNKSPKLVRLLINEHLKWVNYGQKAVNEEQHTSRPDPMNIILSVYAIIVFGILIGYAKTFNQSEFNIFTCLVESKPVRQEVSLALKLLCLSVALSRNGRQLNMIFDQFQE